ncbi:hypothetical protein GGS26DRAFT_577328 [Hypomontagnella submonticulosa]|nr:hypothetical protein GGS26DRAFT_577328 [Hypomontagnella submonticulosa]
MFGTCPFHIHTVTFVSITCILLLLQHTSPRLGSDLHIPGLIRIETNLIASINDISLTSFHGLVREILCNMNIRSTIICCNDLALKSTH